MVVDKDYCMSSFLTFRYVEKRNVNFSKKIIYRHPELLMDRKILVDSARDIDQVIAEHINTIKEEGRSIGMLLSGGMDSAILASYLTGCDAYTFRFLDGRFQKEELQRAEYYAKVYGLKLHYVDISWNTVVKYLDSIMLSKGGPVHSIEPQICQAAYAAKENENDLMIIGNGSDYVFGGFDQLLAQDWLFDDFVHRYTYVEPKEILVNPIDMAYVYEKYRDGVHIDFLRFIDVVCTEESYGSYFNAFQVTGLDYFDPYERLKMKSTLDLERIRNGESKYLIRELFRMKYPDIEVPAKIPMPRPVDEYFKGWKGPVRDEFRRDIDISKYSGNQRWLIWCLEKFLSLVDELK